MDPSAQLEELLLDLFQGQDKSNSIDNLRLEMSYALCGELQSAQLLKFQAQLLGMFYTRTFQKLNFN